MVLDVNTKHVDLIPSLQSSENSLPPAQDSCIHSIEINPSRTLLATSARNSNDVAIYRLPTLDPICVGENAHSDWIFDQTWLDDQFLVSGSRDGNLALWRVTEDMIDEVTAADHPSYHYSKPLLVKKCKQADKVRSLCFNNRTQVKYSQPHLLQSNKCVILGDSSGQFKWIHPLLECSKNEAGDE